MTAETKKRLNLSILWYKATAVIATDATDFKTLEMRGDDKRS
jgi:hypothetical protein